MNNGLKSITLLLMALCINMQAQAMKRKKEEKRRQQIRAIERRSGKNISKKRQRTEAKMMQQAIEASLQTNLPTKQSDADQIAQAIARSLTKKQQKETTTPSNSELADAALARKLQAEEDKILALSLQNSTKASKASNISCNFIDPTTTEFFKNKKYKKKGTGTIANPYVVNLSSIIKKQTGSVCGVHSLVVTEITLQFLRKKITLQKYKQELKNKPTQSVITTTTNSVKAKDELMGDQISHISSARNIAGHAVFQNLTQTMQHNFVGETSSNLKPCIDFLQKLKNSHDAVIALSLGDMVTKRENNKTTGTSGHWITIVAQIHNNQIYLYYFDSAKNPRKERQNKHIQCVKNLLQLDPIVISSLPTMAKKLNDIKQNLAHSSMAFNAKMAFINDFIKLIQPLLPMLGDKLLAHHKPLIKQIAKKITELCSTATTMPDAFMMNMALFERLTAL